MKRISILGATGSIGDSAFKVLDCFPESFQVVLLCAGCSWKKLASLALKYRPRYAVLNDELGCLDLRTALQGTGIEVLHGEDALCRAITDVHADLTLSAMVGAAGLRPTMAAIHSGSDIALANKESMVIAGTFMNQAARMQGVNIIPVDSEHNAIHQCLLGGDHSEISRLILTASGGPFRTFHGDFSTITCSQALKHPTWSMGPKITIDSSTLMNKALEVIEAHHLFQFPAEQIDVVVHPQSIVHSMVEYRDGSILAQMGKTDMCHPIQYALSYPERWSNPFKKFDFSLGLELTFEPVDRNRFPCLDLAYQALQNTSVLPCVLNAANEIAVDAFLKEKISYTSIYATIVETMAHFESFEVNEFEATFILDLEARAFAADYIHH